MKTFFTLLLLAGCISLHAQNIETVVQRSGGGDCQDFTISPDGLLLAKINTAVSASEIEIWSTKTGLLLRVINTNLRGAGFADGVKHVRFWKGSKCIITGTLNGNHEVYDVQTGMRLKVLAVTSYVDGVFAVCEKSGVMACIYGLSLGRNQMMFFDLYKNIIYDSLAVEIDGITALEYSPDGKSLAVGTEDGSFHILDLKTVNRTMKLLNFGKEVNYLQWTNDNYLLVSDSSRYTLWDLRKGTLASDGKFAPGSRIVTNPSEDGFYQVTADRMSRVSPQGTETKTLGIRPDIIHQFKMDQQQQKLYILTDNFIKVWDMKNISEIQSIKTTQVFSPGFLAKKEADINQLFGLVLSPGHVAKKGADINQFFRFVPSLGACAIAENDKLIIQYLDTTIDKKVFPVSETINFLSLSKQDDPVITLTDKLQTWTAGKPTDLVTGTAQKLLFNFPADDRVATTGKFDSVISIYDTKTGAATRITLSGLVTCGALSPSGKQIAAGGSKLFLIDAQTQKQHELYDAPKEDLLLWYGTSASTFHMIGGYTQLYFSPDGKKLFAVNFSGQIKVWDLATYKIDTLLNMKASWLQFSADGKLYIAGSNELLFVNPVTYAVLARIDFLETGDHIIAIPGNYYKASRNGAKAIAFRNGLQTSGFGQFDVIFNRPDLVVQKLGSPSPEMIQLLVKAVNKRLKKMGINPADNKLAELLAPEVSIKNMASIPATTEQQRFSFRIRASDKLNNLAMCNVFVNGVPNAGKEGFSIPLAAKAINIKDIEIELEVELDAGRNLIEVSCSNNKGYESARESFEIFYDDKNQQKTTLYFIAIGANDYKDTQYNLKYPAKDITDVAALLKTKTGLYDKLDVTLLTGEKVTRQAVKGLKNLLNTTKVGDEVIIYWSGHGLIDRNLDYYLATYDMDFKNPANGGLEYSELENLLDGIPAHKRLLFIDACHSGEIDKDDSKLVKVPGALKKVTASNTKGVGYEELNVVNTAGMYNELFVDVRRNTGASIISAAGSAEFAFEGDKWNNGVFTYALINGLAEKKADLNNDGVILISELQTYLRQKVPELTNGKQKPTSRSENLVSDWRIW